ncbi:MAG: hypothetical protein AABX02_01945, partial [archaeon]
YVPNSNLTAQVYAGSITVPSGSTSTWTLNMYRPTMGYAHIGGGTYYPFGYNAGSYPVVIPSMYSYGYYPYYGAASYPYNHGYAGCGYTVCYR